MDGEQASVDLRQVYGEASDLVQRKALKALDKHCRAFIAASPFLVISSADASGAADVSPRGDAPGFVAVLDERTLLIPDRPGNRRIDTLSNIQENPHVGLLFLVPGMNETLRVNGTAEVTLDAALLQPLAVRGKLPKSGILVTLHEAFLHCAKAMMRSRLWDPAAQIDRKSFPSLGQMIADQIDGVDAEAAEVGIQDAYKNRLY
jgi:PPOX class probable FMN-dependent enzyme